MMPRFRKWRKWIARKRRARSNTMEIPSMSRSTGRIWSMPRMRQRPIIRLRGRYYDCDRGVWFESGDASGPWGVCDNVPDDIYTIPPRYPIYNVRYVRVYHHTQRIVYVGYTAGYTGCYVFNRSVVYGTGYNYHGWYRHKYFARPATWGFGIHYEPWSGWAFGAGWWRPQGWLGYRNRAMYGGWWGPREYEPAYRPTTRPAYRPGYHPAYHQAPVVVAASSGPAGGRRTGGMTRSTFYDLNAPGVRRPAQGRATQRHPQERHQSGVGSRRSRRLVVRQTGPQLRRLRRRREHRESRPANPASPQPEAPPALPPPTRPAARPANPAAPQPETPPLPPPTRPASRPANPAAPQPETPEPLLRRQLRETGRQIPRRRLRSRGRLLLRRLSSPVLRHNKTMCTLRRTGR